MAIHGSGVNFENLIRDLADMYPFEVGTVVLVELVANSLDSNATTIYIEFNPQAKVLVLTDNGSGMTKSYFDQYHDFAAGLKTRGMGIGFAGVEIANGDRVIENAETRPRREPVDAIRRMAAKLQTEGGKEIYRQRKKIVEPVFGQMKFNLGFRRFRLRGLDKAGGEWTLVCLVHNIKKIYAKIVAKWGELDSLTRELEAIYNPA